MSYNALRMECPHCFRIGEHKVVRTDPRIRKFWAVRPEENAGRHITFRERTKLCRQCGSEFQSVELASLALDILDRLVRSEEKLRKQVNELAARCEQLGGR